MISPFFANEPIFFIPFLGRKIDAVKTHALGPPIFEANAIRNRQNQFFTIVQNMCQILMMIPPVAEIGGVANHGHVVWFWRPSWSKSLMKSGRNQIMRCWVGNELISCFVPYERDATTYSNVQLS